MPLNESVIGSKHILYTKEPYSRFKIVQTQSKNEISDKTAIQWCGH